MRRIGIFIAAAALGTGAAASEPHSLVGFTPAGLINEAYRFYGGRGVVAVTGYLRYDRGQAELWQSAEAAEAGEAQRACVAITNSAEARDFLRRHDGRLVRVSGIVRRNSDSDGVTRIGSCNIVGLELLRQNIQ